LGETPNTLFNLWDLVNDEFSTNGGHWTPQVRYAMNDRVLFNGALYIAKSVFQAQPGQTPNNNPSLWSALPNDACGQLVQFCQNSNGPDPTYGAQCLAAGRAGDESACLGSLGSGTRGMSPQAAAIGMSECTSECLATTLPTPCSGLCNNPIVFTVAGNGNFQSGPIGTGATCYETQSRLESGTTSSFAGTQTMIVNGRPEPLNTGWKYPLPPLRHNGYCIQTTAGGNSWASFSASAGPN
jgi:hypothetical protein